MTSNPDKVPNKNFLAPVNFTFQIKKCPAVNFFIQKVNIPDITLPSPISPNPMVNIPYIGDHVKYGKLEITFKVDEDLQNYLEIHNWIKALGKPIDFIERKKINQEPVFSGEGEVSDISLSILSSTKMANFEVIYTDCHPVFLSKLIFDTTDTNINYLTASATFDYTYYEIVKI